MPYGFLADVVVGFHFAYVAFVVGGELMILLGLACHWQWVRNLWFRLTHLLFIGVVAAEAVLGMACPLTVWEDGLRELAGQTVQGESFLGRLLHNMLFIPIPPAWIPVLHIGFGVLVLLTFVLAPPRWRPARGLRGVAPPA
jgi:hypothetical protein